MVHFQKIGLFFQHLACITLATNKTSYLVVQHCCTTSVHTHIWRCRNLTTQSDVEACLGSYLLFSSLLQCTSLSIKTPLTHLITWRHLLRFESLPLNVRKLGFPLTEMWNSGESSDWYAILLPYGHRAHKSTYLQSVKGPGRSKIFAKQHRQVQKGKINR